MSSDSSGKAGNQRTRAFMAAGVVVVLAAVIAGVLVVRSRLEAGSVDPLVAGGPSVSGTAGGLTITLRLSTGPYFLSELVAAESSITNHSQTTYTLQGSSQASQCGAAVHADLRGGGQQFQDPTESHPLCALGESTLRPGDTWNILELIPIAASEHVTISAEASFIVPVTGEDHTFTNTSAPFTHGFPTLHISVSPLVPANRTIDFQISGKQVMISAPAGAKDHLYYQYIATCHATPDSNGEAEANTLWQPISGTTLNEPSCPGVGEIWKFSIGAPGYYIASGVTIPQS